MEDTWETHKENIRRLYIVEDKTCQQVAAEMKAEYGFDAKAGKYQRQFEKWKFRKSLTADEWKFVGRRIQKRKAEQNKESELEINGFVMNRKKIKKALSRYSESTLEKARRQAIATRSCTPEGIVITTPPQQEPLTPFSFPVFVENLPSLRFLQTVLSHASVFTQLLSSFTHLSINNSDLLESIILDSLKSSQNSLSAPLSALVDMVWKSSLLANGCPTIPLGSMRFVTTLLEVVNNTKGSRYIASPVAQMVFDSLQMAEGKRMALTLLKEHSPVFETLAELLFKYALVQSNIELVEFLLQHSHIGPNDRLRFEDFFTLPPTPVTGINKPWMLSPSHILPSFGQVATPTDYAILTRSSSLIRTLRMSGAIVDIQGRHGPDMLRKIGRAPFREVIIFLLDEGIMNTTNASEIWGGPVDTPLFRRSFRETVQEDRIQEDHTQDGCAQEDNIPQLLTELLLEWSIRNDNLSLTEFLLEQGTTITWATFFCAIQHGNLHVVNRALEAGMNANAVNFRGMFPLRIAAERGDLSMVQSLLHYGAEVEPRWSSSPMFWSIPSHEIVRLFLKRGANLHVWDNNGLSPLHHFLFRRDPDTAMFLIDWGVCLGQHPKRTPFWVPTPLQIAANRGYDAVVEKLLDRDVDVNENPPSHCYDVGDIPEAQYFYGDTALSGAIRYSWGRWTRMINRLIGKGANPNAVARYGDTPLSIAIDHGDKAAVQSLVEAGASLVDSEAFRAAAAAGDLGFLRQSLENGFCLDDVGTCALSNAVYSGKMQSEVKMRIVSFLINRGACTSEMKLAQYFVEQNPSISPLLLSHGAYFANVKVSMAAFERYQNAQFHNNICEATEILTLLYSMPSIDGEFVKTCFLYGELISAAGSGNVDMVKAHIDAGINVASFCTRTETQATSDRSIAFQIARLLSQSRPPANWLPSARLFDHPRKEHASRAPGIMASNLRFSEFDEQRSLANPLPSSLYMTDPNSYTLRKMTSERLLAAAIEGGPTIIELLHKAGLDVDEEVSSPDMHDPTNFHGTALQYAIQQERYASADALIQAGADVDAPAGADRGLTALQAAAIHGHIGIACKLLEKGAEINAVGGSVEGRTALEGAAEWGRLDMVQLLLDNGADITDSAFGEAQYRNSTKFAKDEGYPAIARLIKSRRLIMGYSDLSCHDSV